LSLLMQKTTHLGQRRYERGQTILLVAVSLVSLLAMAALAIDIVTLYVARSEIQRAADAAALAAAKAIADSGVTSLDSGSANLTAAQSLAQNMATAAVTALVNSNSSYNLVNGTPPTLATATPIPVDFSRQGNPHVTIQLSSSNLPTFFSRIWGGTPPSVTATATAEAYNPANLPTITPIAPTSVKPWLVANADPNNGGAPFVNTTTPDWVVDSAAIGESFDLVSDCQGNTTPCNLKQNPPKFPRRGTRQVDYVPALVTPNSANVCPISVGSCNSSCLGASSYELSVECADVNAYSSLNCGTGSTTVTWDSNVNPGGVDGPTAIGAECLIHATGPGAGPQQDTLNPLLWPNAPMQITGGTCSASPAQLVANSSSVATIPIIDTAQPLRASGQPLTIVGFLQAFINQVDLGGGRGAPPAGSVNITVLNIAGCSSTNNNANPVVGGSGTSPVPVRLITPP
jgi:hypothetical protein